MFKQTAIPDIYPLLTKLSKSYPLHVLKISPTYLLIFFSPIFFIATAFSKAASLSESTFKSHDIEFRFNSSDRIHSAQKITSRDLGHGNFSWNGKLIDDQNSIFSFTKTNEKIFGTLRFGHGQTYRLTTNNDGVFLFSPAPQSAFGCAGCKPSNNSLPIDPRKERRVKNWRNGDGNLIDLLVAYTSDAKSAQSFATETEVKAYVQNAISESNLCFMNSKVNASIRLVHLVETNYTETQNPSMDLNRTVSKDDGYLDDLHSLRDQYGADLVTLLISQGDGTVGGIAKSMTFPTLEFEDSGFNVVVMDQIGAPNYSLLHEIGHNMGCLHNREDAMNRGIPNTDPSNNSIFKAFNYGKRWIIENEGYRTIMSYDTEGAATYSNRIPFFSNPNIEYQGVQTGDFNSEDNAQVLNRTAPYVSNFRNAVVQEIIPSVNYLTVIEGNASSLTIRLATKPDQNMTISAQLDSAGDQNFILVGSGTLTFSTENWNLPQTLQIYATFDPDSSAGESTLYLSANEIPTANVKLNEKDFGLSEGDNFFISGVVQNSLGIGINNVDISLSSGETFNTDEKGTFLINLANGWTGSLTASKSGHSISPSSLSITAEISGNIDHLFTANRSQVLYVDEGATGNQDGSNWTNAYQDLSEALESLHPFSEIWVKKGMYQPGVFRSDFFFIPPDVSVYGGFNGTETERSQRNPSVNETILSGDIGITGEGSDNSFHIVVPSSGSHLEGFTIEDGNASENFSDSRGKGAGLYAKNASFTLSECVFKNNRARQKGGAIYLDEANASLANCSFTTNLGTGLEDGFGYAGAIYANKVVLSLTACQFAQNKSELNGGGIFAEYSTINSTSCTFSGNQNTDSNGGGAMALKSCIFNDINSSFLDNFSASSGGAVDLYDSNISLSGTFFRNNQSSFAGGALSGEGSNISAADSNFSSNQVTSNNGGGAINLSNGYLHLVQCQFSHNLAPLNGGGIYAQHADLNTSHCLFISNQNTSNNGGGAIALKFSTMTDNNSSLRFNSSLSNGGALYVSDSTLTLYYSQFTGNRSEFSGGGLYALDSNVTASRNKYDQNYADSYGGGAAMKNGLWNETLASYSDNNSSYNGGGLNLENSNGLISDTNFTSNINLSFNGGGGLSLENSSPQISNCRFLTNSTVSKYGGAMYMDSGSSPHIEKSFFIRNKAIGTGGYGGGLYFFQNSSVLINECLFLQNSADSGGAFATWDSRDLNFTNCRFIGNEANVTSSSNGGVCVLFGTTDSTLFVNCLLSDNHANQYGGVIKGAGTTQFVNCTVSRNSAGSYGGVSILFPENILKFENSIVWQNTAATDGSDIFLNSQTVTASSCILDPSKSSSSISGADNINADPLFVDSDGEDGVAGNEDDNYNLQSASPAIDEADTSVLHYSTTDILRKTRYGSAPDIGAYEYRVNSAPTISNGTSYSLSSNEDQEVSFTFSASDSDADDLAWAITTNASNGIVTINSETGQVSYLPNSDWSGTDSFVIAVSDGTASSSISITATVIAVNDPLLLVNKIADQTLQEDDPNFSIDLASIFSDPDGDILTYSVESSNQSLVSASVQEKNLILSLALNQFGLATITLSASSDSESASTPFELVVTAVNDSPVFDNLNQRIEIDEHIPILEVYDFNASDQDTDTLLFSVSGVDADDFEINASTGSLAFKESPDYENPLDSDRNNTYSLTVLVTDPSEASDAINVTIYVKDTDEFAWTTNSTLSGPWKSSDWFGTYYENVNNWIYHIDHGWLYREGDSMLSTWFYDNTLKWLWTNNDLYPFLYSAESSDWMYFLPKQADSRNFYDFATESWVILSRN